MSRLHPISGCENNERKADVVFIHGLGGDALSTWRHGKEESSSWPHWLGKEFPETGVWSLGYAASPTRWGNLLRLIGRGSRDSGYSMPLPDRAGEALEAMVQRGLGEHPLLFICHSLGGLLAKQILRKANDAAEAGKKRVAENTRAVLFLATPHAGAELATLANGFRAAFPTVSIEDLREHDAHLRDLFNWYRNYAEHSGIRTATYFELRGVKGLLPIVNPTSAHPGVGADPVGLDEDHLSIAKPREHDALVCGSARSLLRDRVIASPRAAAAAALGGQAAIVKAPAEVVVRVLPGAITEGAPSRIPREMPPVAHKFFGREAERKDLAERLRAGLSTAVVGAAGLGKTALAAAALADVLGADAAGLESSPFPDGMVYLDLYRLHGETESAWNTLANRLCGVDFLERRPARDRAAEACRGRRVLIILEGGEEADGGAGRGTVRDLLGLLSPENRWLLLTRLTTQSVAAESVYVREALHPNDATALLEWLTRGRPLDAGVRGSVLDLLEGHPLALHWAGNLLASDEEDPAALAGDWRAQPLPRLSDRKQSEHTLRWLYDRSVRGLDVSARQALAAAGLLAHAPFGVRAIAAAFGGTEGSDEEVEGAREALRNLVRRGLLRRDEGGQWRFTHVLGYRFARDGESSEPAMRDRLGQWLQGELTAAVAASGTEGAGAPGNLLEHAAALLRADKDQRLWKPLASGLLYKVANRLEEIGRLDLVARALGAVAEWFTRFPEARADEPYWRRERSVLAVKRGDVLRNQGTLAGALAAYRESLEVRRRLAEADASNAGWQRDLSVSQIKVGDVLWDQGDLAGALAAYRESLAASRRLPEADASNAGWQRDLSVGQERVGDVLRDQGDLAGALAEYHESLAVRRRLAESDASNAGWQRDLSVSRNKVGDVLRDQGDLPGALEAYRESLVVRQRLAEADASNTSWQRDLSVSQNKVGDVLLDQGDLAGALAAYRESLAVRRRLAEADASNAVWQRDLSVSQERVGDVLRAQGDLDGALAAFRESLVVRRRLAESDASNAVWQRDLSFSLTRIAQILERQGDRKAAARYAEESLAIFERLAALDRSNVTAQKDVSFSRAMVARLSGGGE